MRLCLVEDNAVTNLELLTLTRPVFELLLGTGSLASKIARAFGIGSGPRRRGVVIRSYLAAIQRQRDARVVVNDRDWQARGPLAVVNGRWVPPEGFELLGGFGSWVGLCDGQPACAIVGSDEAVALEPGGVDSWFDEVTARHGGQNVNN